MKYSPCFFYTLIALIFLQNCDNHPIETQKIVQPYEFSYSDAFTSFDIERIKMACKGDSNMANDLLQSGIRYASLKNNSYDTLFIYLNSTICDSIAISESEFVEEYRIKGDSLISEGNQLSCHFGGENLEILKGSIGFFLIDIRVNKTKDRWYESLYRIKFDSCGKKGDFHLKATIPATPQEIKESDN